MGHLVGCSKLTSVIIPEGLEDINERSFNKSTTLIRSKPTITSQEISELDKQSELSTTEIENNKPKSKENTHEEHGNPK